MGGRTEPKLANERLTQAFALFCLLLMGGWVLFGPALLLAEPPGVGVIQDAEARTDASTCTY